MISSLKKYVIPLTLTAIGVLATFFLYPLESARVEEHLLGFPDDSETAHGLRPILLAILCLLPAIGAFIHAKSSIMDRYLTNEFLKSFGICFTAFLAMLFLMELQNHSSEMKKAQAHEVISFYLVQIPGLLMMIIPYSLMLSLLWSLGKMSKSQEIVAMIQSGRSVCRIMMPLVVAGLFLTAATGIFSYHWAPFAEAYKRTMLSQLRGEPETAAENVGYGNPDLKRLWTVGRFPRNFATGEPLENITINQTNEDGFIQERFISKTALWDPDTTKWHLTDVIHWSYVNEQNNRDFTPEVTKHDSLLLDYPETPWQIIRPGLKPDQLGIPELSSWIENHPDHPLSFKRAYRTWWHFRWAQPAICLVIVLLAAPLGISFSRRGPGGGVAVAIFLSAGMLFCSEVFPTLGESGHLQPALAAWATNMIFLTVAIVLFYRRASGQPIYQTIKKLLPSS